MEAVGARLGRSSTRYSVPATVFTGSVRSWEKKWVPLPNPNSSSNNNNHNSNNNGNDDNASSRLLIYKWTPVAATAGEVPEDPPRKKFRYVPAAVTVKPRQEDAVKSDAEVETAAQKAQTEGSDAEPDENEAEEEEEEQEEEAEAVDTNGAPVEEIKETNLDLNLG